MSHRASHPRRRNSSTLQLDYLIRHYSINTLERIVTDIDIRRWTLIILTPQWLRAPKELLVLNIQEAGLASVVV
jgi:hypothetical protein